MAGVKGRSGRQKAPFQVQRQKVIDRAWQIAEETFNDPNIAKSIKIDLAKSIIVKSIPQEMEHSGNLTIAYGYRNAVKTNTDSALRN